MSKKTKKIVCLGGGNAMPKAVLAGLKKYPIKLSVICAMLDSGGSAGRLRKEYKVVSPGDIRRAFIALANTSPVIENLFNYRFQAGALKGHNFANLLITALELSSNNYEKTIDEMKKILNVKHEILPVTLEKSELYAVLENGKLIAGETNIDVPKRNKNSKIKRVFLKPKAKAYPKALRAIMGADLVIIGPGDLYSSLAQILLVGGISKALKESRAKKVYICNIMTKRGETNDFSVSDFVKKIEELIGKDLDSVILNTKKPSEKTLAKYKKTHPELLDPVKIDKDFPGNKKYIGADLLSINSLSHDPKKLSKIILKLCKR
ncbi:MAG: uridine diphosphate-N-acetylglucosamine-binding protein YvcK [Candidatus Nealsonbacteria bacterium]